MFYLVGIFRTWSTGDSISSNTERTALRWAVGEARLYRSYAKNAKSWLLFKENQIPQVKEFSTFLCMGRCKGLGSLKACLWYVPHLSGASTLHFNILSILRLTSSHGGLESLITMTSLWTDTSRNTPFLTVSPFGFSHCFEWTAWVFHNLAPFTFGNERVSPTFYIFQWFSNLRHFRISWRAY